MTHVPSLPEYRINPYEWGWCLFLKVLCAPWAWTQVFIVAVSKRHQVNHFPLRPVSHQQPKAENMLLDGGCDLESVYLEASDIGKKVGFLLEDFAWNLVCAPEGGLTLKKSPQPSEAWALFFVAGIITSLSPSGSKHSGGLKFWGGGGSFKLSWQPYIKFWDPHLHLDCFYTQRTS